MDIRTQIAAMAMQGMLAGREEHGYSAAENLRDIPTSAVLYADALLEVLKVSPVPAGSSAPPPRAQPPEPGDVLAHCDCEALPGMAHLSWCLSQHREQDSDVGYPEEAPSPGELVAGVEGPRPCGSNDRPVAQAGEPPSEEGGPPTPSAAPKTVFVCESNWPDDPPREGTITFDDKTRGRFCAFHGACDEAVRREMHKLHGHRNRPTKAAKTGGV